jgi:hypothetical protein
MLKKKKKKKEKKKKKKNEKKNKKKFGYLFVEQIILSFFYLLGSKEE